MREPGRPACLRTTPRLAWTAKLGAALAAAAIVLGAAPGAAGAALSCERSGGLLEVAIGASGEYVNVLTDAGRIEVSDGFDEIACTGGTPTVLNTDTISIHNEPELTDNLVGIIGADTFTPGLTLEAGDDEIEIFVNLNDGAGTSLAVSTSLNPGRLVFGAGGINPNATDGEELPDDDIDHGNTAAELIGVGDVGPDLISAHGGRGTGGPVTGRTWLMGGSGDDTVHGGDGPDLLLGEAGRDTIAGFAHGDELFGGPDDVNASLSGGAGEDKINPTTVADPVDGGPGDDFLSFRGADTAGSGVSASLEGTGAEQLEGTEQADVLIGDGGPNLIRGLGGDDQLDARGAADILAAGPGDDALQTRDGESDTSDCGEGSDTVTADTLGIDMLSGCENATFPGVGSPGGGPPGIGAPGEAPPRAPRRAAFGARTLVTLALTRARTSAAGPLAVRVTNANGFPVTGTLSGRSGTRLISRQRSRRVRLGAKPFSLPARAGTTVALTLPMPLRQELRREGRLSLRLTARLRDPAGNARTVTRGLRPRAER